MTAQLAQTIDDLVITGKGILAADESTGTIEKRFKTITVPSTEETRRQYRALLATTDQLSDYISGVILFEETLTQQTDAGQSIPAVLTEQGMVPGIKVDKGLTSLPFTDAEKITQGLDGLAERLQTYQQQGARFAKWRCVYDIAANKPSARAIAANAHVLARYAAICQANDIVPIVEPEVLMDGDHSLADCAIASEAVFSKVFESLRIYGVKLEHMILKPNMIVPGKACSDQSNAEQIALATSKVLLRTVPAAVPSINFLSGGQSPEQATHNLQAINALKSHPWLLSFSYGRALQELCLKAWAGQPENRNEAQAILLTRAQANGEATRPAF